MPESLRFEVSLVPHIIPPLEIRPMPIRLLVVSLTIRMPPMDSPKVMVFLVVGPTVIPKVLMGPTVTPTTSRMVALLVVVDLLVFLLEILLADLVASLLHLEIHLDLLDLLVVDHQTLQLGEPKMLILGGTITLF